MNAQKVYDKLSELSISFETYNHEAVFTVEEMKAALPNLDSQGCKNLFLRDQKGKKHFLVVMPEDKPFNVKDFSDRQDLGKLSFASEKRLLKYLGVAPGSVSPFGIINDVEQHVIVYIDKDLENSDSVCFHPNDNTASIVLSVENFKAYLDSMANKKQWIKI